MTSDPLTDKLLELSMIARRVGVDPGAAGDLARLVARDRPAELIDVAEAMIEQLLAGVGPEAAALVLLGSVDDG